MPATAKSKPELRDFDLPSEAVEFLQAAADAGGEPKPKRFSMLAYNGGPMRLPGYGFPVVIDLAGLALQASTIPALRNHSLDALVGHIDQVDNNGSRVRTAGAISGANQVAGEIIASAAQGFPWQASVGARPDKLEFVGEGIKTQVNGRSFVGPLYVARKSTLFEVSFVPIGADGKTSVRLAAAYSQEPIKMNEFEKWLQAKGFVLAELKDEQKASLQAMFDAEQKPPEAGEKKAAGKAKAGKAKPDLKAAADTEGDPADEGPDPVADMRAAAATEAERIGKVRDLAKDHPTILASAISEGWDAVKTELEVLRATRPQAPAMGSSTPAANQRVLEAAVLMANFMPEQALLAQYGAETLDKAYRFRRVGIHELIIASCQIEGVRHPGVGGTTDEWIRAGFSTATLPNLLAATANKVLLAGYQTVESAARRLAAKLTANDFKTHTGVQLTGDFKLTKVGADGALKHATVGESTITYSIDTYGRIFGITRQMEINDDLGAFYQIPRMLGRGAALALEDAFWTLVLANTGSYFVAGNSNYISGADTVLASASLGTAVKTFRKMKDTDGNPILLNPKFLVVPPELEETADELYTSTNVNTGGSSTTTKVPNKNTHAGKYQPVVTPYLSNSAFTGYSTTAWYLWGDPQDVPAFGIGYLNGVETPVIEEAALEANLLGRAWRAYFDFGVTQYDKRGAVKSAGA